MFRLIAFLLVALVGAGGFLAIDYRLAKAASGVADAEGLGFGEYLGDLSARLTGVGSNGSGASALPSGLAAMLPQAPDGWTVRPAVPADTDAFLAKKPDGETALAGEYVAAVAVRRSGEGLSQAALTYEKGERRVIFQAVRYPNVIFTRPAAMQQRIGLQSQGARFAPAPFMTVRGLDVTEDLLPKGMRARYFLAEVGAQIQIRVVASQRMSDADLLPFFETLHVRAMNAFVVDRQEGLGEIPVIVLASALDRALRDAYAADRLARAEALADRRAADRLAAEAAAAADDAPGRFGN